MYLGRIVETAPTEALFANPRHPYTQGLLRGGPAAGARPRRATVRRGRGDPPSPIDLPTGCRFHPRCPIAQEPLCHDVDPELVRGPAPDHRAACHFAWIEKPASHVAEVELDVGVRVIEWRVLSFEADALSSLEHAADF